MRNFSTTMILLGMFLLNNASASTGTKGIYTIYDDTDYGTKTMHISDPFESFNRKIYKFNKGFDTVILKPITDAYDMTVPKVVKNSITNGLSNLNEPLYMANYLLQGDLTNALLSFWRFFFNVTLGMAGTNDFAEKYMGATANTTSLNHTLEKYCIPHGPYLVLPIVGAGTIRSGIGKITELSVSPINFAFKDRAWLYIKTPISLVDFRNTHRGLFDDLQNLSVDDYSMIKSIYSQKMYYRTLKYKHCM